MLNIKKILAISYDSMVEKARKIISPIRGKK